MGRSMGKPPISQETLVYTLSCGSVYFPSFEEEPVKSQIYQLIYESLVIDVCWSFFPIIKEKILAVG